LIDIPKCEIDAVIKHGATRGVEVSPAKAWEYLFSRALLKAEPNHHASEVAQGVISDFSAALATGKQLATDSFAEFLLPQSYGEFEESEKHKAWEKGEK
jgi:hypothetical protein